MGIVPRVALGIIVLAATLAAAAGCGGERSLTEQVRALRDRMCACTTSACARAVEADKARLRARYRRDQVPREVRRQVNRLDRDLEDCGEKLRDLTPAEAPPPAADAAP